MALPRGTGGTAQAGAAGGLRTYLWLSLGWLLILAGLPMFLTPIPLGAIMIAAGVVILARSSARARSMLRRAYRRFPETLRPVRKAIARLRGRGRGSERGV